MDLRTRSRNRVLYITMYGGVPWGFRLTGGGARPLRIAKIRRRSKAHQSGLQPGDILHSVNGVSCSYATHENAVHLISQFVDSLTLELEREEERVLVFHNDIADYEETEEQPYQAFQPYPTYQPSQSYLPYLLDDRTHVAEVYILPELPPEPPETKVIPASDDVTPIALEKLMREATPEPVPVPMKKVYGNSSFFGDSTKFPTIEEEKEMARRVAQALTDVRNRSSRGASMFERQRQRAAKWVTAETDDEDSGLTVDGAPRPFVPAPAPLPKAPKSVQEYLEEMQKAPNSMYDMVAPTVCFEIAAALHHSSGRGAQIFAKRRAKSEKWVVDGTKEQTPPSQPKAFAAAAPPRVVARVGMRPNSNSQNPPAAAARSRASRTPVNENLNSTTENGFAAHVHVSAASQASLAVQKLPPLQTKTFNTQPKGWMAF